MAYKAVPLQAIEKIRHNENNIWYFVDYRIFLFVKKKIDKIKKNILIKCGRLS